MKRILLVFGLTAAVLLLVFSAAQQYAERSVIPRFCADQAGVIKRVEAILTKDKPVGEASKRPFIIAAKLIFLAPQRDGEDIAAYIKRLHQYLARTCTGV